ncbi:uncharacterized protein LOC135708655 [Ochlerotatus camptorhynchus]|uniref:uncharacterized protein LOC135708655 n=1 Tax=Ochlerotatus camptorhynchus TaxID=644619 RepID=UPI0031DE0248
MHALKTLDKRQNDRQARNKQNSVFRRKKRQQEDQDREAMENLYRVNDTRQFYEKLNSSRKGYVTQADMCKDLDGNLLTNKCEVIEKRKQYYDEQLNDDAAETKVAWQQTLEHAQKTTDYRPLIFKKLRRITNNKATGVDQLPSELLKYGGEALAGALHWMIAKIWEEEILPEEWMEGVTSLLQTLRLDEDRNNLRQYRQDSKPLKLAVSGH